MNVSKIAKVGIMQTQTGTPYYCPPEVWNDKPYSSKCDIWSLGCVIYELTALKPPFLAKNMNDLFNKVQKGAYPAIPKHFSPELAKVISKCLNVNPVLRPSADEIAAMPEVGLIQASEDKDRFKQMDNKQDKKERNHAHRRSASEAKSGKDKIDLLGTIKLPRNLK